MLAAHSVGPARRSVVGPSSKSRPRDRAQPAALVPLIDTSGQLLGHVPYSAVKSAPWITADPPSNAPPAYGSTSKVLGLPRGYGTQESVHLGVSVWGLVSTNFLPIPPTLRKMPGLCLCMQTAG